MAQHKVLVPTDGSEFSRQVLPYLRSLLDPRQFTVTLLRVASAPEGLTTPPPRPLALEGWHMGYGGTDKGHPIFQSQVWEGLKTELRDELEPEIHLLTQAGFQVVTVVRFGDPAEEIIDVAENEDVSLVVMATHGRSGLERLVMGSVAEAVLRRLHIPVMMVRPQPTVVGENVPAEAHPAG
jgi:nucleotide-binding universal stress UspA family protein